MTLQTRWRKVVKDLMAHRARTILVIAAITVGVFAVGFVANAQSILLRELARGYDDSLPAAATIAAEPFDEAMVDSIRRVPGVVAAEGQQGVRLQILAPDGSERELQLTAVRDVADMTVGRVAPVAGPWPPQRDGLLVERLSADFLGAEVGENIIVVLDDGIEKRLPVVGIVHDANVPSAGITNFGFGYATLDTLRDLGLPDHFSQVSLRVASEARTVADIEALATAVEDKLEKSGRAVFTTDVPTPGEHWAQSIIETLVLLFTVFGFLILGLSGFLVVNTITALIAQQVQQIGVMKLVGGRRLQIMGMYFIMVMSYGLASLLIGIPLSILAAQWVVGFAADLLNVRLLSFAVPLSVMGMQTAVGLLVPLLAALWPVISGVRVTTFKALNSQGISSGSASQRLTDAVLTRLQRLLPLPRPLIISLRNTVRKKARLLLTLATLIMGTALFIAVLSVRDSVQLTIDDFLRYNQYDVSVNLSRSYRTAQIEPLARQLPDVIAVESWLTAGTRRVFENDTTGERMNLTAVPADTQFMSPQVSEGRWLLSDDTNTIVINTDVVDENPDLTVGSDLVLSLNGRDVRWQVVGVVLAAASGPAVYVNYDHYARVVRLPGEATTMKVLTTGQNAAQQEALAETLSDSFTAVGIDVTNTRTTASIRANTQENFNIVIWFLVMMAILLAIVGGLGLTTTMSINVLERIREIGVLRAIGASDGAVRQIVLAEGVMIGLLSWLVGVVVSLPVSQLLSRQVGNAMLGFPLSFSYAFWGMVLWLVLLLALAAAASLGPARNASRLTIREVLAYE